MSEPFRGNEYAEAPPNYSMVIQRAIEEWVTAQDMPLPFPVDDADLGDLALLITKRLVQAGLIEAIAKTEEM